MNPKYHIMELVEGYQYWVQKYVDEGWNPFIISFMFNQLRGSNSSVLGQMRREIERVYSRLPTRFHRVPNSRAGFKFLPRMILFLDRPVFKWEKKSIRDISVNNGLHYTGIALTPPFSRFDSRLDLHFVQNHQEYLSDKLARIHVTHIVWDPQYVTDYAAKSVKRGSVSEEHIIILPRSTSEMKSASLSLAEEIF